MNNATQILTKFAEINSYLKKHPNFKAPFDRELARSANAVFSDSEQGLGFLFIREFIEAFKQAKTTFAQMQEPAVKVPATAPAAGHLSTVPVHK